MTTYEEESETIALSNTAKTILLYCLDRPGVPVNIKIIASLFGKTTQSVGEACKELISARLLIQKQSKDTLRTRVLLEKKTIDQARTTLSISNTK